MQGRFVLDTQAVGRLGEDIAAQYLGNRGFTVVAQNYRKKYGEIDIVARVTDVIHFVEVKTVSHGTRDELEWSVTHETWRPEELVHAFKLNQIRKTAETWLREYGWVGEAQVDVAAVRIVPREKYATVNLIENIELEPFYR